MPRCNHVPITVAGVTLLFIATGVDALAMQRPQSVSTQAVAQTFIVSGTLVRDDKSPIEGARLTIAEAKDGGYAISIDKGWAENPSVITDAHGRFSVTVRRSLFKDRQEFVVVVPRFAEAKHPMRIAGSDVAVKIDKTTREYKLGKITHDSPIVR